MKILSDFSKMQRQAEKYRKIGQIIGLVPTMGMLHKGHLSLIRIMRAKCDILVVSIFVNPTQFGPNEDYDEYPRDLSRDVDLCRKEKVDIIFQPSRDQMYPDSYHTFVNVEKISEIMCGTSRPGHFQGVTTIVTKLFNITKPHLTIFGEKDYQQLQVIKQLVRDLNIDIKILSAPIVREFDGLALSSRNKYLREKERKNALVLYQSLQTAKKMFKEGNRDALKIKKKIVSLFSGIPNIRLDYAEIVDSETLEKVVYISGNVVVALAVYIGKTRLIDNILLKNTPDN
jgi:pantoate--beta-alanine ligase